MEPLGVILFGCLVVGVGAGVFFMLRSAASQALNPSLKLDPDTPRVGQLFKVYVRVEPRQEVVVDAIELVLECRRREFQGAHGLDEQTEWFLDNRNSWTGKRSRVEYDSVVKNSWLIPVGRTLKAGQPEVFSEELQVSPDGLATDREGNLTIRWVLTVRFQIPRFPDAVIGREVVVKSR